MYIVAIAWIYVVFMMSLTEHSVVAGVMTFLLYCVFPLGIVLYLLSTPKRRRRQAAESQYTAIDAAQQSLQTESQATSDTEKNV